VRVIATPADPDADRRAERELLSGTGAGYHEHPGVYAYFGDLAESSRVRIAGLLAAAGEYGTELELAVTLPPASWSGQVLPRPVPHPDGGDVDDRHGYVEPSDVDTMLVLDVAYETGGPSHQWWLSAEPPRGTHPDPAGAWDTLCRLADDPFTPVPREERTYARAREPGEATVRGIWHGRWVQASFTRANDGEIARWDRLGPVLRPRQGRWSGQVA